MKQTITIVLVGAAIGLAVATYAGFWGRGPAKDSDILNVQNIAVTLQLAHFLLHQVRYLLGSNAFSGASLRRQFKDDKTEQVVITISITVVNLFAVIVAGFVAWPLRYFSSLTCYLFLAGIFLFMQRYWLVRVEYQHRASSVVGIFKQWIGITLIEILVSGFVAYKLFYDQQIGWAVAGAIVSVAIVIGDILIMRQVYFENEAEKLYDRVFEPENATTFYEFIASSYDNSPSATLTQTQQRASQIISVEVADKLNDQETFNVLDLGGGTGSIYRSFAAHHSVYWTNVDLSQAMLNRFNQRILEADRAEQLNVCISQISEHLEERRFDLILMSLILTSLPEIPDFSGIVKHLKPEGLLLIVDIDPSYTLINPFFDVDSNNGHVALKCTPVDFPRLLVEVQKELPNLCISERILRNGTSSYAFIAGLKRQ